MANLDRIDDLFRQGRYEQARASLDIVLRRDPDNVEAIASMATACTRLGLDDRAEHYGRRLVALLPSFHPAMHNLGALLLAVGKHDDSLEIMLRAVALDPAQPQSRIGLGNAYMALQKFASAAATLREGLALTPGDVLLTNNLGHALHAMGRADEGLALVREAASRQPDNMTFADGLAAISNYAPGVSAAEIYGYHAAYGALVSRLIPAAPTPAARPRAGPPRVGFISPDLREHAVAYFVESFLKHNEGFFTACYNIATREDAMSARLRKLADLWRHVPRTPIEDLARTIRGDRIDILIDLAGHTNGHRLPMMQLRPARVQATYFGYPNTTGVPSVDWRIADTISEPEDVFASEKMWRLDPCFACYTPPPGAPAVRPRDEGPVVFAAFSSLLKLNTPLIAMWARVLAAVPGSRMVLRHYGLTERVVREEVTGRFAAAGVDPSRVVAEPPTAGAGATLPAYHAADITLDTFPYNGTTTICESLYMGVPVVSLHGPTPAGRIARSLLATVGLEELSADDEDGFVRIAAALAQDPARLAQMRAGLRARAAASPMCDGAAFARRFGEAVRGMCGLSGGGAR